MRAAAVVAAVLLLAAPAAGCGDEQSLVSGSAELRVTSPAFAPGEPIPREHTCDGADRPPPLRWSGVPAGAREIAVVVDDPDAPSGTYTHWTVWGLAPERDRLEEPLPAGAVEGRGDAGEEGWSGPCPPPDDPAHRYRFTVLALSEPLDLPAGAQPDEVRSQARSRVLAWGRLEGSYERPGAATGAAGQRAAASRDTAVRSAGARPGAP